MRHFYSPLDPRFLPAIYAANANPVHPSEEIHPHSNRMAYGRAVDRVPADAGQENYGPDFSPQPVACQDGWSSQRPERPPVIRGRLHRSDAYLVSVILKCRHAFVGPHSRIRPRPKKRPYGPAHPNGRNGIDFVRCRICGDRRRVISGRHLSKHETDRNTYMEEYARDAPDSLARSRQHS
jgi:hypothetical protein